MAFCGRFVPSRARRTSAGLACLVVCTLCLIEPGCLLRSSRQVRTTVQQVCDLSPEDVHSGIPVRLRGTITYFDPWGDVFFMQDATGGIAVDTMADRRQWTPGQVVQVAGIAGAGGRTPLVIQPSIRILGTGPIPAAVAIAPGATKTGRYDYRRVSIGGMVESTFIEPKGQLAMAVNAGGRKVTVRVLAYPTADFLSLVGTRVTIRGVASSTWDVWGNVVNLQVRSSSMEDVIVERPAVPPLQLPISPVRSLEAIRGDALPVERVRIQGKWVDTESGSSHVVDDGTGRIRVVLAPYAPGLSEGDVDLAGFLKRQGGSLVLDAASAVGTPTEAKPGAGRVLFTKVGQFHHMSALEARQGYRLRITGTVTYFDPVTHNTFVQDDTGGSYVFTNGVDGLPALRTGEEVQIDGVTFPGDFAPNIGKPEIRVLGPGRMPSPRQGDIEDIFSGNADSQWVELEGVIHGLDSVLEHALITVRWGSRSYKAHILGLPILPERFRGARVRLRGVAGSLFNRRRQLLGIQLFVPGMEYVKVLEAAPADPFSLPLRSVDQLLQFSPGEAVDRLTHVQGVVTLSNPDGPTWIRAASGALSIRDHAFIRLTPGDVVDVVGFPEKGPFSPEMHDALLRKMGSGPSPEPAAVTADEAREGNHDAELVRIDGILNQRIADNGEQVFHLQSGGTTFTARIADRPGIPDVPRGAVLRLTGICAVEVDSSHDIVVPRSFAVHLRSPADIAVIRDAPWWTPERTFRALAIALSLVLLTISWVVILRRRVHRQTRVIARQLAEEAALREEAQQASRAKSEFLANVTHELRTPMNGIVGFTALALETDLAPEQRDYLETVRTSADSLLRIINDILDFSRSDAGGMELDSIDFSPAECLRSAIRVVEAETARKNLRIEFHCAPEIPPALRGDPERLRQILLNLLSNAVKFTETGGVSLTAEVESESKREIGIRISVADTGIGIPLEKQAVIFEPFRQADGSVTRKYGGTGLGLAISRNLVQLLGGRIWVESEPGKGSTFLFTAHFRKAESPNLPASPPPVADEAVARSLSILVAEDNAVNRRLLVTILESRGHRVQAAINGLEAVEFFRRGSFDLVLMDLQMPELGGLEATSAIRESENGKGRVPIYAFTAHAMAGDREKCLNAGMDGYVSKPVQLRDLLALINEIAAKTPAAAPPRHEPTLS